MIDPKIGDHVRIIDGSEAHGDTGRIWHIWDDGSLLIELDAECGALWPTTTCEVEELEVA